MHGGKDKAHMHRQMMSVLKEFGDAFEKAGIAIAIGGIDVSYNVHDGRGFAPHFQLHLWVIAPSKEFYAVRAVFDEAFPQNNIVKVPVRVKQFDGKLGGYAYGWKTDFGRRFTLPAYQSANKWVRQNTRL